MTSSKLYRNRKQNFQVLKPNVNCITLAAGCSTSQVYNINWVVPPAWYIPQKWWGHVPLSFYGGATLDSYITIVYHRCMCVPNTRVLSYSNLKLESVI